MTNPCRSDCPGGDCAGCAFPSRGRPVAEFLERNRPAACRFTASMLALERAEAEPHHTDKPAPSRRTTP